MKSRLFARFDPEHASNQPLRKHLRDLLGLSPSVRSSCIAALESLALGITDEDQRRATEALEAETKRSFIELAPALEVGRFFLQRMQDDRTRADSERDWAQDLVDLNFLSPPEVDPLVDFLCAIRKSVLPRVEEKARQRRYAAGVMPSLKAFGITVELRGVFETRFRWGTSVKEYASDVSSIVPVASIHVGVDAGPQTDFYFQADDNELQLLIDSLEAARLDMRALMDSVTFTSPNKGQSE